MKVINSLHKSISFSESRKKKDSDKNPISKFGEQASLTKATVIAGVGFGAEALWWLCDDGFLFNIFGDEAEQHVERYFKDAKAPEKVIRGVGTWVGLMAAFVGCVALLYTLFELPKIMYQGKVNAFKKGKDMDVYVKGNKVERELYDQMNDKAKDATEEEKKVLSQQYLKLKAAKNQTPDYINPAILPPSK